MHGGRALAVVSFWKDEHASPTSRISPSARLWALRRTLLTLASWPLHVRKIVVANMDVPERSAYHGRLYESSHGVTMRRQTSVKMAGGSGTAAQLADTTTI
eukprot:223956-Amphidinium_carterae.1